MAHSISIKEAKQIDLVDYLAQLGYLPKKIRGNDYWYLSPLREENTPSFKVNRDKNIWYDHGSGQGGNFIDFGILYHGCTVGELLHQLSVNKPEIGLSFHPQSQSSQSQAGEKENFPLSKILITDIRPLSSYSLFSYLESRFIPKEIASRYCKEVDFVLYNRKQTAIGFQNDAGGYELRNSHFKGSSSPKATTYFDHTNTQLAVFEGFFDFLSYQTMHENNDPPTSNYLVLNSLSFFDRSRDLMERHDTVNLYLDSNKAGISATAKALQWDHKKYIDQSQLYAKGQDLNDWLIQKQRNLKQQVSMTPVNNQKRKGYRL